jgi:hypothetical protein
MYTYQMQIAPDVDGSPGTWKDVGPPSASTSVDVTGLTPNTPYWARSIVHDAQTSVASSPVPFTTRP